MKIAYVLYPDFTALDLVGPYEVISRWPDAEVHFVASTLDPVRCDRGLTVIPTDTPTTLPNPDLIVVPGSEKPLPVMEDRVLLEWLRAAAPNCHWTASVCTGAGLYAAAGLLDGQKTTTHWAFRDNLRAMGVEVVADRVVRQGNHISGAGVSAGIDMALALTERVHGRALAESLQLAIEYDPQPPFDSGSPTKADASTLRLALRVLLGDRPVQMAARINHQLVTARLRRARCAPGYTRSRDVCFTERRTGNFNDAWFGCLNTGGRLPTSAELANVFPALVVGGGVPEEVDWSSDFLGAGQALAVRVSGFNIGSEERAFGDSLSYRCIQSPTNDGTVSLAAEIRRSSGPDAEFRNGD